MKYLLYITIFALAAAGCSSYRSLSMEEDDIYYVPGKEKMQEPAMTASQRAEYMPAREANTPAPEAVRATASPTAYEESGYWIGGYKGNRNDLREIQRIIDMYPNGFASFNSNGYDIAMNLSFDPDWNVYTDDGRFWWFPSSSNIDLYSSLLLGSYPKYIWTTAWDNPRFDSWAFDMTFNRPFRPGFSLYWGTPGWSFGFGWSNGWYDPWHHGWYDPWFSWNHGWYDPWYGHWHGHYPGWYPWHDPWHTPIHPGWNRPRPTHPLAGQRPSTGGGIHGIRPEGRPGNIYRPSSTRRPSTNTIPSTTPRPGVGTGSQYRPGATRPQRPSGATTTRPNNPNVLRPGSTTRQPNTTTRPNTYDRGNATTRPTTPRRQEQRPATNRQSNPRSTQYTRPQTQTRPRYTPTPSRGGNYQPARSNMGGGSRPTAPTRPGRR